MKEWNHSKAVLRERMWGGSVEYTTTLGMQKGGRMGGENMALAGVCASWRAASGGYLTQCEIGRQSLSLAKFSLPNLPHLHAMYTEIAQTDRLGGKVFGLRSKCVCVGW